MYSCFVLVRTHQHGIAFQPRAMELQGIHRKIKSIDSDRQKSGTVYKINCTQCHFVYYGQTERSLNIRIAEHKKAVANFDQNSKVANHVHRFNHNMDFINVKIVGFEAWFSTLDPNSGNDHIVLPEAYKVIARA